MRGLLAAAMLAAASISGVASAGMPSLPFRVGAQRSADQIIRQWRPSPASPGKYLKNSGWTDARFRRAARKRRSQAKNRRANRG